MSVVVRLNDGPEAGANIVMDTSDEPAENLLVFRTRLAAEGVLVCVAVTDPRWPPQEGDHIYKKVSRSELFDKPGFKGHRNVMAGCSYDYIGTLPQEVMPA